MGLRDYKRWKKEEELKTSETILSLEKRIAELELKLQQLETPVVVNHISAEDKKKMKMAQDAATKPQDFINLFTGDLEEFNPNA